MSRRWIPASALALALPLALPSPRPATPLTHTASNPSSDRFLFQANGGQLPPGAEFAAAGDAYTVTLSEGAATVRLRAVADVDLRLAVEGALAAPLAIPLDRAPGHLNVLRGSGPDDWALGVEQFGRVAYQDVLPGVDVEYYGKGRSLEIDLVVAPGIDPSTLALRLDGADALELTDDGVRVALGGEQATLLPPVVYQADDHGDRRAVDAHYRVDDGRVRFALGDYDPDRALVIDPVLLYGSFLGGSDAPDPYPYQYDFEDDKVEGIRHVAVDSAGSIYVAGRTNAPDFPGSECELSADCTGISVFITKLADDGETLAWTTLLGTDAFSRLWLEDLTVTPDGEAIVVADSRSADFDELPDVGLDPIDPACRERGHAYVMWLDDFGQPSVAGQLPVTDVKAASASDAGVVITGSGAGIPYNDISQSPPQIAHCYPMSSWGTGLQNDQHGGAVLGFDLSGSRTFLSAILVGAHAVRQDPSGASTLLSSGRVTRLSPNGTEIAWQTSLFDLGIHASATQYPYKGFGFDVDRSGNVYLAITAGSGDLLATSPGAYQPVPLGRREVYVLKLDAAGAFAWATYIGGEDNDVVQGLAVDDGGSVHLVGNTMSYRGYENGDWIDEIPFPIVQDPSDLFSFAFGPTFNSGVWDGFYTRLTPDGLVLHSSYFGGSWEDVPYDVALTPGQSPVIVGQTRSRDLPVTNTGVQQGLADFSFIGSVPSDGFILVAGDGIAFPRLPTAADYAYAGVGGDPISTFTGELYLTAEPDLVVGGGTEGMSLVRYYASGLKRSGALGRNWRHSFMWSLEHDSGVVRVETWKGRELRYRDHNGAWESDGHLGTGFILVEDGAEWALADAQRQRVYRFNASGALVRITSPQRVITVTPGAEGPAAVTDGAQTFTFAYDGSGKLTGVTNGGRSVGFSVVNDLLVSATDPISRTTQYTYDAAHELPGLLTAVTDPGGETGFSQTYDDGGRVVTQASFDGRTWSYAYEGSTTTITDPDGHTSVHIHDPRGSLIAAVDELGRETSMGTTGPGARGSVRTAGGNMTDLAYDEHGNLAAVALPGGALSESVRGTYALDGVALPLIEELHFPDGTSEQYGRDAAGRVVSFTTRLGETFTYTYDAQGRVDAITDPDSDTITFTYDTAGNVVSTTDAHGVTTTSTYDTFGRIAARTRGGDTESFTWDDAGQLISVTDGNGGTVTATYHPNGEFATVDNALGDDVSFAYDPQGRLVQSTDELGGTITFTYNDRGDLLSVRDENDDGADLTWDAAGQLIATTDGEGHTWTRAYDDDGRLASLTSPEGRTTALAYDARGELTSITTPEGRTWASALDANGFPTAVTDPAGHTLRYAYDDDGRIVEVKAPGDIAVQLGRNANGHLTALQLPRGGVFNATMTLGGRQLAVTDPLGASTSFGYDAKGRVDTVTTPETTIGLTHDGNDNVTERAFTNGLTLTQAFDALDRRVAATGLSVAYDLRGAITSSNGLALGRDPASQLTSVEVAAGKSLTFTYDGRGLVTSLSDWTGASLTFEHNASGWLTAIRRPNGVDTDLTYDNDGLLTGVHDTTGAATVGDQQLTRGPRGFVTSASRTLPTVASATGAAAWSATYDLACRRGDGTYDGEGRLTAVGGRTFGYDDASRLTSFDPGGAARSYTYDALGNLLTRTEGGVTNSYTWNYGLPRPTVQVVKTAGVDDTYVITTPGGMILGVIDAATDAHRWYHHDEAGNLRFTTDDAGAVAGTFAHSPYGELLTATGVPERFTWGGALGVLDDGDGVFHMRERVYDAATARFTIRDPVPVQLHPQLVNPYAYAAGNPVFLSDPGGATPSGSSLADADKVLNGTSSTANLGALSGPNSVAGIIDYGEQATRKLTRFAGRRLPAKALRKIGGSTFGGQRRLLEVSKRVSKFKGNSALAANGTKLFAAAAAWEVVKGRQRMNRELDEAKRSDQSDLDNLSIQLAAVDELLRTKRITPARGAELKAQIVETYNYLQNNASAEASGLAGFFGLQNRQVGIFTESLLTFKNAIGGAVPVPLDWVGLGDPPRPTTLR